MIKEKFRSKGKTESQMLKEKFKEMQIIKSLVRGRIQKHLGYHWTYYGQS